MKYEDIKGLSKEQLKKLPRKELMEALEDYAEKEHDHTFDDSKVQIN